MKTASIYPIAAVGAVLTLVLAACGGDEPEPTPQREATEGQTTTSAEATTPTGDSAPQGNSQKPPPAVTSLGETPIAAGDLHDSYFHWNDETITVVGHPALFMDDVPWQSRVELGDAPEVQSPALLECAMASRPDGRLTVDTTLTLRGTVSGPGRAFAVPEGEPAKISLDDCELVASGDPLPPGGDPWALGAEPIPVGMLHEAMLGWQGMPVTVVGYYQGTTTSTPGFDPSRTVTSHGIKAGVSGSKVVECHQQGDVDAPAAMVQQRDGATVTGIIGEPNGDVVVLDNCQFAP